MLSADCNAEEIAVHDSMQFAPSPHTRCLGRLLSIR